MRKLKESFLICRKYKLVFKLNLKNQSQIIIFFINKLKNWVSIELNFNHYLYLFYELKLF